MQRRKLPEAILRYQNAMRGRRQVWLQAAVIVAATVGIYWPALRGGWVWDDQVEVAGNGLLREPGALLKIWFAPPTTDYFPLKTTVQWLGWRLWGAHVLGWHLLSLSLHLFSAFWFWRILSKLGIRLAWIGGLLFAIHPLAVESVAWIAELKNTLSMAFMLLAADAWVERDLRGALDLQPRSGPNSDSTQRATEVALHLSALFWFAAALLSKSTVVMFPAALLLYGWWAHRRIRRADLLATIPFFALSLALGLITIWFQQHRAIIGEPLNIGGPWSRLAACGLAIAFYLGKIVVPIGLAAQYPRWSLVPPPAWSFLPWLGLAGLIVLWLKVRSASWARATAFALGWYVLNLLPVVGLVPMSYLRISWVADHFAYLALLGPMALAAAGAGPLLDWLGPRGRTGLLAARVLGAAAAILLVLVSRARAATFRSDEVFWRSAQRDNDQAWMPYSNLGLIELSLGHPANAISQLEQGVVVDSDHAELRNNYGKALASADKLADALPQFAAALQLRPNFVDARINFASALAETGHWPEAIAQYRQVLLLQPDNAEVHGYLGFALSQRGDTAEATTELQAAIRLNPNFAEPHDRLGTLKANTGQISEAIKEFEAAIRIKPDYAEALANLGLALTMDHNPNGAIAPLRRAIALRPDNAASHAYLGFALASASRYAESVPEYEAALRLSPQNPDIHYNYGMALRALGRTDEARAQVQESERLQHRP